MKNLDACVSSYKHILLTSDPPIPIESLIKWVSTGNTLAVLNTYGNGLFAYLLGMNSSSPLLSIRSLGRGKVLYVNSFSANQSALLKQDFLARAEYIWDEAHKHCKACSARSSLLPISNHVILSGSATQVILGHNALKIEVSDIHDNAILLYQFKSPMNFDGKDFVSFYWYGSETGK
jgi:hypothetical protein